MHQTYIPIIISTFTSTVLSHQYDRIGTNHR